MAKVVKCISSILMILLENNLLFSSTRHNSQEENGEPVSSEHWFIL